MLIYNSRIYQSSLQQRIPVNWRKPLDVDSYLFDMRHDKMEILTRLRSLFLLFAQLKSHQLFLEKIEVHIILSVSNLPLSEHLLHFFIALFEIVWILC